MGEIVPAATPYLPTDFDLADAFAEVMMAQILEEIQNRSHAPERLRAWAESIRENKYLTAREREAIANALERAADGEDRAHEVAVLVLKTVLHKYQVIEPRIAAAKAAEASSTLIAAAIDNLAEALTRRNT